jgi:uncharacterized protein YbjT (DUF2867 family)
MTTVFLTGGTGHIGGSLAARLVEHGTGYADSSAARKEPQRLPSAALRLSWAAWTMRTCRHAKPAARMA